MQLKNKSNVHYDLVVCSKSTKKYITYFRYSDCLIIKKPPTIDILKQKNTKENVLAIGGGAVIDTAKIICKHPITAIPTTYSGASVTNHAVYWDKEKKCNTNTPLPKTILKPEWVTALPKHVEYASKIDCLCHIMESLASKKGNEKSRRYSLKALSDIRKDNWLNASIFAGKAINITGTNLIHGLSYYLTGKYKIEHGISLAHILEMSKDYKKIEELL